MLRAATGRGGEGVEPTPVAGLGEVRGRRLAIDEEVSPDRVVSVHGPEMRHGHNLIAQSPAGSMSSKPLRSVNVYSGASCP